ncbi:MAG: APC family permease [Acidobacteria bacterium]|nr:APC family permease [Acidobacteriota bacterium]
MSSPVQPDPPGGAAPRRALARRLRSSDFFAVAFGAIIGVGWVVVLGEWLSSAGPLGAIIAFALGGGLMYLIGLCYAELTSAMPVAGGEIAYAYRAFGLEKAAFVGWYLTLGYIAVSGFEAVAVGRVISYLIPATNSIPLYSVQGNPVYLPHLLIGVGCSVLITWINYRGIGVAAGFQSVLTLLLVAAGLVFITAALLRGSPANLSPLLSETPIAGILAVFITTPIWFVGFDTIPQTAEEALPGFPSRRLGTLILVSIAAATLFYIGAILSASVLAPWPTLVSQDLPTARAFTLAFASPALGRLVLIAGLIGLLTSWNGFFIGASRVLFSLGRARIIPGVFGVPHARFGSPHRAALLVGAATCLAPLLGKEMLTAFVNVSSACIAVSFLGVCLSMRALRRQAPEMRRPYRVRGGVAVATAGAAGAALIILALAVPGSPVALRWPYEWSILAGWTLVGFVLWRAARERRTAIGEAERSALILQTKWSGDEG